VTRTCLKISTFHIQCSSPTMAKSQRNDAKAKKAGATKAKAAKVASTSVPAVSEAEVPGGTKIISIEACKQ